MRCSPVLQHGSISTAKGFMGREVSLGSLQQSVFYRAQPRPLLKPLQVASPSLDVERKELSGDQKTSYRHKNSHGAQESEEVVAEETQQEKFNWQKAWYPLAIEKDLPTDRPTPARLMGNAVVLWKDAEGKWRAFRDLCPHRLAPLSEGRVENGELMCSYHGWQFRGTDGRATVIPQADNEHSHATATASRRSCCAVHPCEVEDGLVWVYGSCEPGAEEQSKTIARLVHPKLASGQSVQLTPWFMRELPYGADVLCENVIDPAHVPFSHHGVQGNRFDLRKMLMEPAKGIDPQKGFAVHSYAPEDVPKAKRRMSYDLSFQPPTLIRYHFGQGSELVSHAVPTDPGKSRIFFTLTFPRERVSRPMKLVLAVKTSKWLLWFDHLTRNNVLDGDNVFLALQDQELQRRESKDWSKNYYMPASLDYGVKALRDWLGKLAEPLPWGAGAYDPAKAVGQSRLQMLNRYEQHTKHCPSCAGAHRIFSKLQWLAAGAAVFAAVFSAVALGSGASLRKVVGPVLSAALAGAVAAASHNYKQKLEFQDYRHPDH